MSLAIEANSVSKLYRLGEIGSGTLSNDLKRWFALARGKEDPLLKVGETNVRLKSGGDVVYSLKDVSFSIRSGETVGVIGKNGAGKSTLLKILSRVTSPTTGNIKIKGRIASLLEVGTGFHPELTGRENIFLNGAILGMSRSEIKSKLDEVIAFSGVERYIDTPVKRYSSGMYVRLAFAVAAHLESEILIVDEVLAVGDAEFQSKCLGKMDEVSKVNGKTVLFVSHNMHAVRNLCKHGLLLKDGSSTYYDDVSAAIREYSSEEDIDILKPYIFDGLQEGTHFKKISLVLQGKQPMLSLELDIELATERAFFNDVFVFDIVDQYGTCIYQIIPSYKPFIVLDGTIKKFKLVADIWGIIPGVYSVSVWVGPDFKHEHQWLKKVVSFRVSDPPEMERTLPYTHSDGLIIPQHKLYNV